MNLNQLLLDKKINNLGYDTIFLEKPVSTLIDFNYKQILSAPPKNNDIATIKELKLVAQATKNRSKKDIELIYNIDKDLDTPFILLLQKYKLKYPKNYIDLFYDIVYPLILNTKGFWNRPRPIQLAKFYNIKIDLIITDTIHTPSYPSGHTVYSSLVASILKNLYPQIDQKELDNIVLETARARVMQGAHYPSDNKASLQFTKFVFNKLNQKLRKYYND